MNPNGYASEMGVDTPPSASRPTRGRPPTLTQEQVVSIAIEMMRDLGLTNVSMRALARELNVPTMTIYHHVPNKAALYGLVVDSILSEITIPGPDEGSWEERLRHVLGAARRIFTENPGVISDLSNVESTEPTRLAEGVFSILQDGGFSHEEAVLCFVTLYTFMTGQIDLDAMTRVVEGKTQHAALGDVDVAADVSADDFFEFGFDVLIEGLKRKLKKAG